MPSALPIEKKLANSMSKSAPIVLALDTSDLATALDWVQATHGIIPVYKLGLEFYLNFGHDGVRAIADSTDAGIFLDLKLHDIPQTVKGAARAISNLNPRYLTVHASGGQSMVRSAVDSLENTKVTGVTILTSLSESDVSEVGYGQNALESAVRLAKVAVAGGARAIVCSPLEIVEIRKSIGLEIEIITPGVRPEDSQGTDDQIRTMTPREALDRGANLVVIGRPITSTWANGAQAMRERAEQIASGIL